MSLNFQKIPCEKSDFFHINDLRNDAQSVGDDGASQVSYLQLFNDIVRAIDSGCVSALVLLDLSAAFDTIHHSTLNTVLHDRFGVTSSALDWFDSYHANRTQSVHIGLQSSAPRKLTRGVPQGSIIGPVEFISYTEDLVNLVSLSSILAHLFADDTQLLASMQLSAVPASISNIQTCIANISLWCASRGLQLNADKTELIWFGSASNLAKLNLQDHCVTHH